MKHIRILAVVLTLLMIGAIAADPVAAKPHQFAKEKIWQKQHVSQTNVNIQSGGSTQVSTQTNTNSQTATATATNSDNGGGGGCQQAGTCD